jgi:hypothetical protein
MVNEMHGERNVWLMKCMDIKMHVHAATHIHKVQQGTPPFP